MRIIASRWSTISWRAEVPVTWRRQAMWCAGWERRAEALDADYSSKAAAKLASVAAISLLAWVASCEPRGRLMTLIQSLR